MLNWFNRLLLRYLERNYLTKMEMKWSVDPATKNPATNQDLNCRVWYCVDNGHVYVLRVAFVEVEDD